MASQKVNSGGASGNQKPAGIEVEKPASEERKHIDLEAMYKVRDSIASERWARNRVLKIAVPSILLLFVVAKILPGIVGIALSSFLIHFSILLLVVMPFYVFVVNAFFRPRPGFNCPCCGKYLTGKEPWICGYCNHKNHPIGWWQSVAHHCENCPNIPKSLRCYHCEQVFCLDKSEDAGHPANAIGKPGQQTAVPQPPPAALDPLDERMRDAERRKEAFEKEMKVVRVETDVAMTEKDLEEARIELQKITSGEFKSKMNDVERFSLGDDVIIRAGAAEEQKIQNDPDLPDSIKNWRIDRLKRFVKAKLDARKPR
jgi:hypothetical protein